MKPLRIALYSRNLTHAERLTEILAHTKDVLFTVWDEEESVIDGITSKKFDALLVDDQLEALEKNRVIKMTELVYAEAVYTILSFEFDSFVIMKVNHLIQDWQAAQAEQGGFQFLDQGI